MALRNTKIILAMSGVMIGIAINHSAVAMEVERAHEYQELNKTYTPNNSNLAHCSLNSFQKVDYPQATQAPLKTLDLSASHLNDDKMEHVVGLLKDSGYEALNLSHNELENTGVELLFDNFPASLKVVDLSHNKLTSCLGLGGAMGRLGKAANLEALDLSYNVAGIKKMVGTAIGEALQKNPPLKALKVRGMGLDDESMELLLRRLSRNTNLAYLDISENPIHGMIIFENLTSKISSITHLEVEDCGMTKIDFIKILVTLNDNPAFNYLAFAKNPKVSNEDLTKWTPLIEQNLGFKVDLEKHTLTRISPLKKPVSRKQWEDLAKDTDPSSVQRT